MKSIQEVDDLRFKYFTEQVFPHLVSEQAKGVLIFIPSYFDFVRVRNFFRERRKFGELNFTQCCEYNSFCHCLV